MAILFLLICVLAPIIVYGTESPLIFYLAFINTILYLVTILAIPNIIAFSAMKKHKTRVEEAYQQGATEEEMETILNDDVEILEKDRQAVPKLLYVITFVNVVLAIIFCVIGVFHRIG